MALSQSIRRIGLALVVALGLTIWSAIATPLLGSELAGRFGPAVAFAGGPEDTCC